MYSADNTCIRLRCPKCNEFLTEYSYVKEEITDILCPYCGYTIKFLQNYMDALIARQHTCDFSRQWTMWEKGIFGANNLIYGKTPHEHFNEVLQAIDASEHDLQSMKILEVGYGHGRLLQIIQGFSSAVYGIDLVIPLKSSFLNPGSVFCADLFHIPIMPMQFDLVICRGVLQHTGDASKAFDCIAEQVASKGMLYLTVYEKFQKKSLFLRKILPYSWRYPEFIRLFLAKFIGTIRATCKSIITMNFNADFFIREYGNFSFGIYDVISPTFTTTHGKEEIISWFVKNGFTVDQVGIGIYVGSRE